MDAGIYVLWEDSKDSKELKDFRLANISAAIGIIPGFNFRPINLIVLTPLTSQNDFFSRP